MDAMNKKLQGLFFINRLRRNYIRRGNIKRMKMYIQKQIVSQLYHKINQAEADYFLSGNPFDNTLKGIL